MNTEKALELAGWDMECQSPLEIRHRETGSFATEIAAQIVIDHLKTQVMTFADVEVGEFFYEGDSCDGVYMLKTPETMVEGKKFNCVTVNASPDEHIKEYVSFKEDNEQVFPYGV